MIHPAAQAIGATKSGQPTPVQQGCGRDIRDGLGRLFPAAPAATPRRWGRRVVIALAEVLAVCLGAIVLLLRVPGRPWDTLFGEDYYLYLPQALQSPWHLFIPWQGYVQLLTRLIAQFVSYLPLADAAKGSVVSGALVAASCALFIFHACAGHITSVTLRALLAAAVILLSSAPMEIADSDVDILWYLLPALFWAVLWRPRAGAGMAVAGLVAFFVATTSCLAFLFAPLLAIRVFVLRRPGEHAVTAGWLAGCLVQAIFVVQEALAGQSRLVGGQSKPIGQHNRPGNSLTFYLHDVVLRSVGWHLSMWLQSQTTTDWATLIVGVALAAALGAAFMSQSGARPFVLVAMLTGFIVPMFSVMLTPWVVSYPVTLCSEVAARYTALPILLIEASLITAADCALRARRGTWARHRAGRNGARATLRTALAVAALAAFLAGNWVADFRYAGIRTGSLSHPWGRIAAAWKRDCQVPQAKSVNVTLTRHVYTIPCDHIRF